MPQLMPFYWMNSVMMVLFILLTLVFLYFYKNMESGESELMLKEAQDKFYLEW